jgi:hypothetical protein
MQEFARTHKYGNTHMQEFACINMVIRTLALLIFNLEIGMIYIYIRISENIYIYTDLQIWSLFPIDHS